MTANLARAIQLFSRWHRRIGITVAVWLILLSLSGVLINHANDWGLDQKALPETIQRVFYPMTVATETEPAAFISWERLILDIHAARFLGASGLWFSDFMAILIVLLSISGIWLWWRNWKRSKKNS